MFRALRFLIFAVLAFMIAMWISESRGDAASAPTPTIDLDSVSGESS
jgi:hypothetical protein|tara:strand:- start:1426 stop:1566 length:141 start_codon:yes stop_codon:yes gene_type:complete